MTQDDSVIRSSKVVESSFLLLSVFSLDKIRNYTWRDISFPRPHVSSCNTRFATVTADKKEERRKPKARAVGLSLDTKQPLTATKKRKKTQDDGLCDSRRCDSLAEASRGNSFIIADRSRGLHQKRVQPWKLGLAFGHLHQRRRRAHPVHLGLFPYHCRGIR